MIIVILSLLIILIFMRNQYKKYDLLLIICATYILYVGYRNNNSCKYRDKIYSENYNCQCDNDCGKNNDCCVDYS